MASHTILSNFNICTGKKTLQRLYIFIGGQILKQVQDDVMAAQAGYTQNTWGGDSTLDLLCFAPPHPKH
ncbi:MAG: hypothetical protein LBK53_03145 [Heliobacteriaceae bacterium]|nr:hypothetical protein [Heliobacteriaceae bacterium]